MQRNKRHACSFRWGFTFLLVAAAATVRRLQGFALQLDERAGSAITNSYESRQLDAGLHKAIEFDLFVVVLMGFLTQLDEVHLLLQEGGEVNRGIVLLYFDPCDLEQLLPAYWRRLPEPLLLDVLLFERDHWGGHDVQLTTDLRLSPVELFENRMGQ